ncbi:MAG: helix-turn-helix transcriptional regulator [Ktedonobacteraceae bacterium]
MATGEDLSFGQRLRRERESHYWTQKQLSEEIVGDESAVPSINRWENDRTRPRPDTLAKLTEVFGKPQERWGTGRLMHRHISFLRNPYFTGRDQTLERLHRTLAADNTRASSQICAISGLGGIGKTQTAIEYVYRYADEYEAVLWVRADSREVLAADFASLAVTLNLVEKAESDQFRMINAVKGWLEKHGLWLLILDNADDLTVVSDFLPRWSGGATILTTRSQMTGPHIKQIAMEKMSREEGINFLLRRIASDGDISKRVAVVKQFAALELWELMDGLPLALDQAGAYIKSAQMSISEYVDLYRSHRNVLLQERGGAVPEHPDAVGTTWSLSFERVEQKDAAAAELLRFCAFLSPDAIPEELITGGAAHFTSPLRELATSRLLMNKAIMTLGVYSLVRRDRDAQPKTLSIHRLVQAVLVDAMSASNRKQWKECVVRVLNEAFPEAPFKEWMKCGRLLPHVLVCASWIEDDPYPTLVEAACVFDKAGTYLREQGQYAEAEPLLVRALTIREQQLGAEHLDTATSLSNLAGLYSYDGKYKQAELLVLRALTIREQQLGAEHPDTAKNLGNLAVLYMQQGKYEQAELLYQQVLLINEQRRGGEQLETARNLNNLAVLYEQQEKYEQAEPLYQRALLINKQQLGAEHPETARNMGNLAFIYVQQGKYEQAELLYQQALVIHEQHSGSESPDSAYPLYGLAELYRHQQKYEQAEPLYQRVLAIRKQCLDAEHLDTAESLQGLADLYREQGMYEQAKPLYQQAWRIREQQLGPEHPLAQQSQKNYAILLRTIERA